MYVTAYNTSSVAVTVDGEGRQIAPRDWGTASTTIDEAKDAISAGSLVVQDGIPDDGHPEAVAARDRTAVITARATELSGLDKSDLTDAAAAAGVPGADDLAKPDLVHALAVRTDVEIPAPKAEPAAEESAPPPVEQSTDEQATPERSPEAETVAPEAPPRKATSGRRAGRGTE